MVPLAALSATSPSGVTSSAFTSGGAISVTASCEPPSTSSGTSAVAPGATVAIRCVSSWCDRGVAAGGASAAARRAATEDVPFSPVSRGLTKSLKIAPDAGISTCETSPVSASSMLQRALESGTSMSPRSLPGTHV